MLKNILKVFVEETNLKLSVVKWCIQFKRFLKVQYLLFLIQIFLFFVLFFEEAKIESKTNITGSTK